MNEMDLSSFKSEYYIKYDEEEFEKDSFAKEGDKIWFAYIPCKYGKIYLQDDEKRTLIYFSQSKEFARKFNAQFPDKTNIMLESDDNHCVVEFKAIYRNELFEFLKAKKKIKRKRKKK